MAKTQSVLADLVLLAQRTVSSDVVALAVIRHVVTAEGARFYGQPIGSVIVRDRFVHLPHLAKAPAPSAGLGEVMQLTDEKINAAVRDSSGVLHPRPYARPGWGDLAEDLHIASTHLGAMHAQGYDINGRLSAQQKNQALRSKAQYDSMHDLVEASERAYAVSNPYRSMPEADVVTAVAKIKDWQNPAGSLGSQLVIPAKYPAALLLRYATTALSTKREDAIGFDLNKAARTVRSAFIKKNGAQFVQAMPKDDQNAWIRAFLIKDVDPDGFIRVKAETENRAEASWKITQAKLAANAAARRLAKTGAPALPVPVPQVIQPGQVATAPGLSPPDPVIHTGSLSLTFTKPVKQLTLGGWAPGKFMLKDQLGNDWMFKPEVKVRGGVPGQYRTDMEHASHLIGNHLGFDTAESRIITFKGERGQAQRWFGGVEGDFKDFPVRDMTPRHMQAIADEQLLDWLIANHDSHVENLLRLNNGNAVGIDKGGAFKYFGKDKLEPGHRPNQQLQATQVYPLEELWKAIGKGEVDQDVVDTMVRNTLQRAARMQLADDAPIVAALQEAQRNRPSSTFRDSGPQTPQELITGVLARKGELVSDFTAMYKKLYADNKLVWSDSVLPDDNAAGKVEGVFSGFSSHLFQDVSRAKVSGVSAFFAGSDIEDGHILFWTEKWDGKEVTRGTFTTRKEADQRISTWLTQHATTNAPVVPLPVVTTPQVPSDIYLNDVTASQINDIARSFGASARTGVYQPRRVAQLETVKRQLESARTQVLSGQLTVADVGGDKDLFIEMVQHYQYQCGVLEAAHQNQTALHRGSLPPFTFVPKPVVAPVVATPVSAPQLAITVKKVTNRRHGGGTGFDPDTGELSVKADEYTDQAGDMFQITVGDSLEMDYRPWDDTAARGWGNPSAVPVSQHGVLRITATNFSGNPAELDTLHDVLQEMGVDLKPAEKQDLELLYWRQLYGILQDRKDGTDYGTKYKPVTDYIRANLRSSQTADQEIGVYRDGFAQVMTRAQVDSADYRPQLSHTRIQDPDMLTGHPYWFRPDVTPTDMKSLLGKLPYHAVVDNKSVTPMAKSGGLVSVEERIRMLGQVGSNRHASNDQQAGGANFVFASLGVGDMGPTGYGSYGSGGGANVLMSPDVARRNATYHFEVMGQGRIASRKRESAFDIRKWQKGRSNAIHVKNGVSLLDDIEGIVYEDTPAWKAYEYYSAGQVVRSPSGDLVMAKSTVRSSDTFIPRQWEPASGRDDLLAFLRAHGITEIRGMPIEDRFVIRGSAEHHALQPAAWQAYATRTAVAAGLPAPRRRSVTPGRAGGPIGGIHTIDDAKTYMNSLMTPGSPATVKGFLNTTKHALHMNAPVVGPRYRLTQTFLATHTPGSSDSTVIYSRYKSQYLMPKDEIDLKKVQDYLNDPTALAAVEITITQVNGKNFLTGGIEAFVARRLQATNSYGNSISHLPIQVTRHSYWVSRQEAKDGGFVA